MRDKTKETDKKAILKTKHVHFSLKSHPLCFLDLHFGSFPPVLYIELQEKIGNISVREEKHEWTGSNRDGTTRT
jgi:hypothetical protein